MSISIQGLTRRYGAFSALEGVSLDIAKGEFVALLGPSGSGKSTLLRILAGLDDPDQGSVQRDGEDLLALEAQHRRVGLVFQHYALFAHMTVSENVAFGLRVRPRRQRPSRREIAKRVEELLRRVQLEDMARRYPAQLSGGQRQRVALARALAVEPSLLLLDEPFGALDAQVRVTLRGWLRDLQRSLGLTTLLVTHDQEEALELADRVVVMNQGRIEQIGTPAEIYREPATPFVYGFIGRANRFDGRIENNRLWLGTHAVPGELPATWAPGAVSVWLRPEHVTLAPRGGTGWAGQVLRVVQAGSAVRVGLQLQGCEGIEIEAEWSADEVGRRALVSGSAVTVQLRELTLFHAGGLRHVFHPHQEDCGANGGAVDIGPWLHRRG
ncbi:sulfate transport system ATP-binding protein [Dyella sp. OK004]|uniref:sulfate/molybdate ABC transporter ATP-binding protein n=1 Tax=Dyella sp. OK004 TaxID=1855292 RepID=UPI0008DF9FF1|nr:sulfate ABC transporter ATP-binding protein [Dyella sp. OK004]SFS14506.1 sulfate transport system ATP-binding protein [Dyella sp. OK004]